MSAFRNKELRNLANRRQPWMAPVLLPCVLRVNEFEQLRFAHHVTTTLPEGAAYLEGGAKAAGATMWVAVTEHLACVGVAWDYVVDRNHVAMVADMLAITSNLALVDDDGSPVTDQVRLLALVRMVCGLQWQASVTAQVTEDLADASREDGYRG